ncbi:MAG: hypothetical protein U1E23_10905 [Reyranellaceae bacterium]
MGAIGFMGAMTCLVVMLGAMPPPSSLAQYALMRGAMGEIATWVLFPSLAATLIAGLLAMAFNPAFHNAGWAWAKLASGILVFEWSFTAIIGPLQEEATRSAAALAGSVDPATLGSPSGAESGSLWVMLAVATINVVLGVWRPRFSRLKD